MSYYTSLIGFQKFPNKSDSSFRKLNMEEREKRSKVQLLSEIVLQLNAGDLTLCLANISHFFTLWVDNDN